MTPQTASKHAHIGMPMSAREHEAGDTQRVQDDRQFAPRDKALEYAAAIANRNAELMRRLA